MKSQETIDRHMTAQPYTIGKGQPLQTAHHIMREHRIRHLPVLDGGRVVGIVSDRDLALVEAMKGVDVHRVTVEEAMTADPYCVDESTPLEAVVRHMAQHKMGAALVTDRSNHVVGIFTAIDAMQTLAWHLGGHR